MAHSRNILMWFRRLLAILCLILMLSVVVDSKVCGEIDVRNNQSNFEEQLRGCTIILGSVDIVLMERNGTNAKINEISFPELREINGYLMFNHVYNLESLRTLFPNLSVIRGERLFLHYALAIFDMPDLREVGLISLIRISRGLVLIKCPMLCYVNTIDWNAITTTPHKFNGIRNYLEQNDECPTKNSCPAECDRKSCWNNKDCQIFERKEHDGPTKTCHAECIGGCEDTTPNKCNVCRNFRILDTDVCVHKCPSNLFVYKTLCVNESFCTEKKLQPLLGQCRDHCDSMVSGNITDSSQCTRACGAFEVDSLTSSEMVRGCKIILGDLFIRIKSGDENTLPYLERNLGDIEEIVGIFKVTRSPVLTSLSFMRNLRIIHGMAEVEKPYTLEIVSNENLQELWNFNEKKSLILERGKLLVHYNSKLCLSQIRELQKILNRNPSEDSVSIDSNGYEQTCSAKTITTWNEVLNDTSIKISWEQINMTEAETIIGYIIFYIEAPERNITHRGIDPCEQYGWMTQFIQNVTTNKTLTTIITNLTQNTQYAYYVKTHLVPTNNEDMLNFTGQGQSVIEYVKTKADIPSPPQVRTLSKTHNSLTLVWHPLFDKELIEFYRVDYFRQPDEHEFLDSRNYCSHPKVEVNVGFETSDSPSTMRQNCSAEYDNWLKQNPNSEDPVNGFRVYRKAQCAAQAHDFSKEISTYIENHKNCGVGKKCTVQNDHEETNRFSRQIHEFVSVKESYDDDPVHPEFGPNYIGRLEFNNSKNQATFEKLQPYTLYIFQFFSCSSMNCSSYFFHFDRTEALGSADNIDLNVSIDPYDPNRVHLDFKEPDQPNGLTVAFQIEKHDLSNYTSTVRCITRKQHYDNGMRYTFDHLDKGGYLFRARSISLAQTGNYTDFKIINVSDPSNPALGIIGFLFLFILLISILVVVGIYFYRRMEHRLRMRSLNASTQNIMLHTDENSSGTHQDEEVPPFYRNYEDRVFF